MGPYLKSLLQLVVVQKPQKKHTTTSVPLSKDLLTHELTLKILAGAIKKEDGSCCW